MQLTFDQLGPSADEKELLRRLEGWPQNFGTIKHQTGWSVERIGTALDALLASGKIVKDVDATFRPFSKAWDRRDIP